MTVATLPGLRKHRAGEHPLQDMSEWLPPGMPGGIDCDLLIHNEKADAFLFVEYKHVGEQVTGGQQRALRALAKRARVDSWVVKGPNRDGDYHVYDVQTDLHIITVDAYGFGLLVKKWWEGGTS